MFSLSSVAISVILNCVILTLKGRLKVLFHVFLAVVSAVSFATILVHQNEKCLATLGTRMRVKPCEFEGTFFSVIAVSFFSMQQITLRLPKDHQRFSSC